MEAVYEIKPSDQFSAFVRINGRLVPVHHFMSAPIGEQDIGKRIYRIGHAEGFGPIFEVETDTAFGLRTIDELQERQTRDILL